MSHRPKDMGQHYFVEELDSPKGTTGPVADLSWKPPSPSHRDVGLSHIFDRLLCLKHKHPGDHESEVSSKKQNLAIVWGGSSSNTEAGGASVSLPLNQSSIASERKACRRGSKTIAIKDSKRCGRKKVGTSLSGTDLELVEVLEVVDDGVVVGGHGKGGGTGEVGIGWGCDGGSGLGELMEEKVGMRGVDRERGARSIVQRERERAVDV
ncbi:hypothetical protein RHMOL_Rhmol02G0154300 [Rhododendron molle]|uniref:Uncharacterized protein n=1 Tax=Rhododendron molle TaxID=49168 RepID=A0ACC0PS57_RHOML|nr:hypothetical protein RHMOL_Rhmol02G0154300 [Rhododendron molle]